MSMTEVRRQMETNFFGPVRIIKTMIPHFRSQKSGTIINVTSTEGISAAPGIGVYGASKFALEAISESLSAELTAFGIRTLIVEPGGMRTQFLASENSVQAPMSDAYKGGVVEYVMDMLTASHGKQMLDPDRSAQRIVEAVAGGGEGWPEEREKFLRLPLGKECVGRIESKVKSLQDNVAVMEKISGSVDLMVEENV